MSQNVAEKVPTTQQAVGGIEQAQSFLDERAQKGGVGAQRTVADINQALQDAKKLVTDKDLGDSVSKLAKDTAAAGEQAKQNALAAKQHLQGDAGRAGSINTAGLSQEELERLSQDAHEAANQLRRVAQLTVTSPSFRNFLWDWYQLVRDTWAPQLDRAIEQRLRENQKDELTQQGEQKASELRNQASQQAEQARREAQAKKDEVSRTAQEVRQAAARGDAASAVAGARDEAQHLARDARQKLDEQLPPERRRELVQRWENVKRHIQEDPNLRAALDDLKSTLARLREDVEPQLEKVKEQAQQLKEAAKEKSQEAKQSAQQAEFNSLRLVVQDARELLEKFADGQSMRPLIESFQAWVRALQNDQELRQTSRDVWAWVNETKQESSKLNDDQHLQKLNSFIDRGRSLTEGRHRQVAENLLRESQDFFWALRNDSSTNRLRLSLGNVVSDLFFDKTGKFVLKPDVYKELGNALAPTFRDLFHDIRIAHIEEHNEKADFALDNIQIDASDIQPDQLDVTSIADVSVGKQDTSADLRFRISAKGITPKIRNTYFRYEKHTFPKLSDFGSLDAALTGDGLSFRIDMETCINAQDEGVGRTFRARDVKVDMKGLKLDFHNAQHETLYKIFKPLIVKRVTRQMEQTIKDQLYNYVEQLDRAATETRMRAAQTVDQVAGARIVRGVDENVGHTSSRECNYNSRETYYARERQAGAPYESRIPYPRDVLLA